MKKHQRSYGYYLLFVVLMLVCAALTPGCGKAEGPQPAPIANNGTGEAPTQSQHVESIDNHAAICIRVVKKLGHWEETTPWQCFPKNHLSIKP